MRKVAFSAIVAFVTVIIVVDVMFMVRGTRAVVEDVRLEEDHCVALVQVDGDYGSAFPILVRGETTLFLTVRHGIADHDFSEVQLRITDDDDWTNASWVQLHPSMDLAMIWADISVPCVYEISFELIEFGDDLRTVGWMLGDHLLMQGGFAGLDETMSAPLFFGMSGGPVLDTDGRVVGVNEALLVSGIPLPMCSFYEPLAKAEDWLRALGVVD